MTSKNSPSAAGRGGIALADAVRAAVEDYFDQLNGHDCHDLYDLVLAEVERPLLRLVLERCDGNQTRAAKVLGINRGTLRKKLEDYNLN